MNYGSLINGSDIRGTAISGADGKAVDLTEDAVKRITRGFIRWLYTKTGKTPGKDGIGIACGRDSRLSGPQILSWVKEAAAEDNITVADTGLASTPAMFMTTQLPGFEYDGAIMITASHLPWNRNGLKFFTKDGGLEHDDIVQIVETAENDMTALDNVPANQKRTDIMEAYSCHLVEKVKKASGKKLPLSGLHIVVDAGNGVGGFYAKKVLEPLGADTSGSVLLEPDGRFPSHIPNPELPEAMESIRNAVLTSHADFGVIFDTDVDRAGAVLSDGRELNRNSLIAVMSAILLKEHPGTTIVTDSVTSTGLTCFIEGKGGKHHRFKRGYKNVINEAVRLNKEGVDSQLAIETSGHAALKENYFLDDGAYVITRILIELAKGVKLQNVIADLKEPKEAKEIRINILEKDFKACGNKIIEDLKAYADDHPGWETAENNYEGVRVNTDKAHGNGWFLLRMSLHDPILPLNIESDDAGGAAVILREVYEFLSSYDGKIDVRF